MPPGEQPVPDVTVIVPVYNTMPYLTASLDSLVGQTINQAGNRTITQAGNQTGGPQRLHVVAVDDGSTDGSETELDRYAERHPGLFTVVHQANSGGPAAPCNRGLELATGRYVFFLGADDYLADNALEKLVDTADEWGSDVMIGRMVGVGGRRPNQTLFQRDEKDLLFPHSRLPFALANTRLFRRSVLEEHGIRYALDLRIGSDQPFTIEAMLHARRISVLADQPYYFAVRREDSANISFSVGWRHLLQDIGTVMAHVAVLLPPGDDRDALLHRHFAWELSKQLRQEFLELAPGEQQELAAGVAELADAYLTDGVIRRLSVETRLRLRLAQAGRLADLRELIDYLGSDNELAVVLGADGVRLRYPALDDLPEALFLASPASVRRRVRDSVQLTTVAWDQAALVVQARVRLHCSSAVQVRVVLVRLRPRNPGEDGPRYPRGAAPAAFSWPVTMTAVDDAPGCSQLTARLDLADLVPDGLEPEGLGERRWALRLHLDAGGHTYDLPATGDVPEAVTRIRVGTRFFRLVVRRDLEGQLFVRRRSLPRGAVLRSEVRRLRAIGPQRRPGQGTKP